MEILESRLFQEEMKKKTAAVEELLEKKLPKQDTLQKTVFSAMEYSVMAGGKRLRPIITGEVYRLFGGTQQDVVEAFMAAIEMIHTYSLVHDDLPAMDNDDFRRGKETTHKVFGEDMGILAGDALLNYAYETAVQGILAASDKTPAVKALAVLAEKSGVFGMVGGQVVDVEMTGKQLSEKQLQFIYCLKTGGLLEAAFMMGAVLAGAAEEDVRKMEQIGEYVGMAFQIQDDILDVTGTREELGKPIGSDDRNAKTTYVSLFGLEEAKKAVEQYSDKALEILKGLPGENPFLNSLVMQLIRRRK